MRVPSIFSDTNLSFSFVRTTPARNPRTECCCQSVSFIIAAIVAPVRDRSMVMMRACLEPASVLVLGSATSGCAGLVVATPVAVSLRARFLIDFAMGILVRFIAASRRTTEAPSRPTGRRGGIPERAHSPELGASTALLGEECQSFLDNNVAQFGSGSIPPGHHLLYS